MRREISKKVKTGQFFKNEVYIPMIKPRNLTPDQEAVCNRILRFNRKHVNPIKSKLVILFEKKDGRLVPELVSESELSGVVSKEVLTENQVELSTPTLSADTIPAYSQAKSSKSDGGWSLIRLMKNKLVRRMGGWVFIVLLSGTVMAAREVQWRHPYAYIEIVRLDGKVENYRVTKPDPGRPLSAEEIGYMTSKILERGDSAVIAGHRVEKAQMDTSQNRIVELKHKPVAVSKTQIERRVPKASFTEDESTVPNRTVELRHEPATVSKAQVEQREPKAGFTPDEAVNNVPLSEKAEFRGQTADVPKSFIPADLENAPSPRTHVSRLYRSVSGILGFGGDKTANLSQNFAKMNDPETDRFKMKSSEIKPNIGMSETNLIENGDKKHEPDKLEIDLPKDVRTKPEVRPLDNNNFSNRLAEKRFAYNIPSDKIDSNVKVFLTLPEVRRDMEMLVSNPNLQLSDLDVATIALIGTVITDPGTAEILTASGNRGLKALVDKAAQYMPNRNESFLAQ